MSRAVSSWIGAFIERRELLSPKANVAAGAGSGNDLPGEVVKGDARSGRSGYRWGCVPGALLWAQGSLRLWRARSLDDCGANQGNGFFFPALSWPFRASASY